MKLYYVLEWREDYKACSPLYITTNKDKAIKWWSFNTDESLGYFIACKEQEDAEVFCKTDLNDCDKENNYFAGLWYYCEALCIGSDEFYERFQLCNVDDNGNIVISYKDAEPVRSKSWLDFVRNHKVKPGEYYINEYGQIKHYKVGDWFPEGRYKNLLSTQEDAEAILALCQLTRLHEEWVGDWKQVVPKDEEDNQWIDNYWIITVIESDIDYLSVEMGCGYKRLLSFPTSEMAHEFLKCFNDLCIKAKKFL